MSEPSREQPSSGWIAPLPVGGRSFWQLLAPFGVPYALYVAVPSLVPSSFEPWQGQAIRFVAVLASLLFFRRSYATVFRSPADPSKRRAAFLLPLLLAPLALVLWIAPYALVLLSRKLPADAAEAAGWLGHANALVERFPAGRPYAIFRLANSVLLAPLVEELLMRAHLPHWMEQTAEKAKRDKVDWDRVVFSTLDEVPHALPAPPTRWAATLPATIAFAAGHVPAEYPSAAIYYLLATWLYRRTRSFGACVAVHVLVNLLVGLLALCGWTFLW